MIRTLVTGFYLLIVSFAISAQTVQSVISKADSCLNVIKKANGQASFYAEYTDTGEQILDLNGEEALAPASCMKILTSSAALAKLGGDYRYETKIFYDGKIDKGGILNGNIYIVGDGDPALGSNRIKGSLPLDSLIDHWVDAVRAKGIKKINGRVFADALKYEMYTVPDDWPWIDIGNYYGAGASALAINENMYSIYFRPGSKEGSKADVLRTEPEISWLSFINKMMTGKEGSGDNGYIYCAPLQTQAVLKGTVPAGVPEFSIKGSIPDPSYFAAYYFSKALLRSGIIFQNTDIDLSNVAAKLDRPVEYDNAKKISSVISPTLREIVFIINKKSHNLYTEQILRELAFRQKKEGSTKKGIEALYDFMKENKIPSEGVYLHDGCGLSRSDAITARTFVKLLSFNTKQNYFNDFYNSLGIAGKEDDEGFFQNYGRHTLIENNARIKDGLIGHVRSHTGYVKSRSGRLIAFSFIANNYSGQTKDINKMHTEMMIKLAELR
ncbi:MAG: D-alanyl-D-alanine carboxypeptidase/D-alanyl-D-alanine-endopeptidase [Clostridiales bacterium]